MSSNFTLDQLPSHLLREVAAYSTSERDLRRIRATCRAFRWAGEVEMKQYLGSRVVLANKHCPPHGLDPFEDVPPISAQANLQRRDELEELSEMLDRHLAADAQSRACLTSLVVEVRDDHFYAGWTHLIALSQQIDTLELLVIDRLWQLVNDAPSSPAGLEENLRTEARDALAIWGQVLYPTGTEPIQFPLLRNFQLVATARVLSHLGALAPSLPNLVNLTVCCQFPQSEGFPIIPLGRPSFEDLETLVLGGDIMMILEALVTFIPGIRSLRQLTLQLPGEDPTSLPTLGVKSIMECNHLEGFAYYHPRPKSLLRRYRDLQGQLVAGSGIRRLQTLVLEQEEEDGEGDEEVYFTPLLDSRPKDCPYMPYLTRIVWLDWRRADNLDSILCSAADTPIEEIYAAHGLHSLFERYPSLRQAVWTDDYPVAPDVAFYAIWEYDYAQRYAYRSADDPDVVVLVQIRRQVVDGVRKEPEPGETRWYDVLSPLGKEIMSLRQLKDRWAWIEG